MFFRKNKKDFFSEVYNLEKKIKKNPFSFPLWEKFFQVVRRWKENTKSFTEEEINLVNEIEKKECFLIGAYEEMEFLVFLFQEFKVILNKRREK